LNIWFADDSVIQAVFNKVFPDAIRQYCIFHIKKNIKKAFHVPKLMKLSDEALEAKEEILNIFNAETSEEAIRRLAVLVEKKTYIAMDGSRYCESVSE